MLLLLFIIFNFENNFIIIFKLKIEERLIFSKSKSFLWQPKAETHKIEDLKCYIILFKSKLHTYKIIIAITNEQINISQGHTIEMHTTTTTLISYDTRNKNHTVKRQQYFTLSNCIQTNNHRSEFKMLFCFVFRRFDFRWGFTKWVEEPIVRKIESGTLANLKLCSIFKWILNKLSRTQNKITTASN